VAYAAFVFAIPQTLAAVFEAAIALQADRWPRTRLIVVGQAALAAALFLVAWTHSGWGLTFGLTLAGSASGVATSSAQALLVLRDPAGAERAMVRWTFFATVGDVLTPLVTAAAIALGFSYRGAMTAIAALVAAQCLASAVRSAPPAVVRASSDEAPPDSEPPTSSIVLALRTAARRPALWAWLFAAASCTLLDEIVVALSTLRLERDQGAGEASATVAAVTFALGALLGTAFTDRAVDRLGTRNVLAASSVLSGLALTLLVVSPTVAASCVALFAVGVTCSPHHALTMAQAYREMPRRPGVVQACSQLFFAADVVAPLVLGLAADRFGLRTALAMLAIQPAVMILCVLGLPRRSGDDSCGAR
jgi:MFS family permease